MRIPPNTINITVARIDVHGWEPGSVLLGIAVWPARLRFGKRNPLTCDSGKTGNIDIITRILVTATEGYLGSLLAPELIRQGYQVIGLDTGFYKERQQFTKLALALPKSLLVSTTLVEYGKA
jgi:hypothetical protein